MQTKELQSLATCFFISAATNGSLVIMQKHCNGKKLQFLKNTCFATDYLIFIKSIPFEYMYLQV